MRKRLHVPLSRSRTSLVLLALLCLASQSAASAQEGVYGSGMFELGDAQTPPGFAGMGDILLDGEQEGPDWEDIFNPDGSWRDDYPYDPNGLPMGNGIPDFQELYGGKWAVFTADYVSTGSEFEGSALNANGEIVNSVVNADHDIGNAYVYWTTDSAGNTVMFAGAERLGAGDSQLEIELNQDIFKLGHGGYGRGEPWPVEGTRQPGDVLIFLSYSNGMLASSAIGVWDGANWNSLTGISGEGCDAAELFCAICNAFEVDGGPWPNYDTQGDPELISIDRFIEVGANVGALLGGSQPGFRTVRLRTPEDAAFGYFGEGN